MKNSIVNKIFKGLVLLKFSLLMVFIFINNSYAEEVKIAFGISVPPYIIQNSNSGIEIDIIRRALAHKGHFLTITYIPFQDVPEAMAKYDIDGIATVDDKIGIDGYFSDLVITYKNFAVTLGSQNLEINDITDLKDKRVSAFQLATRYLGNKYTQTVLSNPEYREKRDQKKHVELLYKKIVDVIIIDENILKYFSNQIKKEQGISPEVHYHQIFPWNNYKVVFKDKKIRDDFNEGLQHIRKTNEYQNIFKSYLEN